MTFFRLLPVMLSSLLLAAHFMRAGQSVLMLLSLSLPFVLLLKQRWVPVVVSVALLLGALEWVYTLSRIALIRAEIGAPWARMALILGAVALLTASSTLVFRLKAVRARYSGPQDQA